MRYDSMELNEAVGKFEGLEVRPHLRLGYFYSVLGFLSIDISLETN